MRYFMRTAIFLAQPENKANAQEIGEEKKGKRMQSFPNISFINFGLFQKMRQEQEFIWAKTMRAICDSFW